MRAFKAHCEMYLGLKRGGMGWGGLSEMRVGLWHAHGVLTKLGGLRMVEGGAVSGGEDFEDPPLLLEPSGPMAVGGEMKAERREPTREPGVFGGVVGETFSRNELVGLPAVEGGASSTAPRGVRVS